MESTTHEVLIKLQLQSASQNDIMERTLKLVSHYRPESKRKSVTKLLMLLTCDTFEVCFFDNVRLKSVCYTGQSRPPVRNLSSLHTASSEPLR